MGALHAALQHKCLCMLAVHSATCIPTTNVAGWGGVHVHIHAYADISVSTHTR